MGRFTRNDPRLIPATVDLEKAKTSEPHDEDTSRDRQFLSPLAAVKVFRGEHPSFDDHGMKNSGAGELIVSDTADASISISVCAIDDDEADDADSISAVHSLSIFMGETATIQRSVTNVTSAPASYVRSIRDFPGVWNLNQPASIYRRIAARRTIFSGCLIAVAAMLLIVFYAFGSSIGVPSRSVAEHIDAAPPVKLSTNALSTKPRSIPFDNKQTAAAPPLGNIDGPAGNPQAKGQSGIFPPPMLQSNVKAYSEVVISAASGMALSESNVNAQHEPAGLTKLMTAYIAFDALKTKAAVLDQLIPVSQRVSSIEGSSLKLQRGTSITFEQAILGTIVRNANDAAEAIGEALSLDGFLFSEKMKQQASALGLTHSVFINASGLPDPKQTTSAGDMALLARRMISDFPVYYGYFSNREFKLWGQAIRSRSDFIEFYPGADGVQTGFSAASGYNMVASAVHGETRLIGVVLGASSPAERDARMTTLLDKGFALQGSRRWAARGSSADAWRASNAPSAKLSRLQWSAVLTGWYPSKEEALRATNKLAASVAGGEPEVKPTGDPKYTWRGLVARLSSDDALRACSETVNNRPLCTVVSPASLRP